MNNNEIAGELVSNFVSRNLWEIVSSKAKPLVKLEKTIKEISNFFGIEKCSLMLKDKSKVFAVIASTGIDKQTKNKIKVKKGEGIAGMAIQEKKAIFMKKIGGIEEQPKRQYKTDNFICYPIIIDKEVVGILNLTDKIDRRGFGEEDIKTIRPIIERIIFVLKEWFEENQKEK